MLTLQILEPRHSLVSNTVSITIMISSTSLKTTSKPYLRINSGSLEQVRNAMTSASFVYYQIDQTMMAHAIPRAKILEKDSMVDMARLSGL